MVGLDLCFYSSEGQLIRTLAIHKNNYLKILLKENKNYLLLCRTVSALYECVIMFSGLKEDVIDVSSHDWLHKKTAFADKVP